MRFLLATRRLALAFVASLALASAAHAQGGAASGFIKDLASRAISQLTSTSLTDAQQKQRFRELLLEGFDLQTIGRFALGPAWNRGTPAQQKAFLAAFENDIVDRLGPRFRDYGDVAFDVLGEQRVGSRDLEVASRIGRANGQAQPVDVRWRLRTQSGGDYKIIDVVVAGVSMANTQRSEFATFLQQNGNQLQALIDAMNAHRVGVTDPTKGR